MGGIGTLILDSGEYTIRVRRQQHKSNLLYITRDLTLVLVLTSEPAVVTSDTPPQI